MSSSGHKRDVVGQTSEEMNGAKLTLMIAQLCDAIEAELEGQPRPVTDLLIPGRDPAVLAAN
jgi:hypothetical protein